MSAMREQVNEALRQVRELHARILEKQRFKGYSGRARALGGCVALAAGLIMGRNVPGLSEGAILAGWMTVVLLSMLLNYGSLVYWFLYDPEVGRDLRRLKPALEAVPALLVGGMLTLALANAGVYDPLYGVWLCLLGLALLAARHVLPKLVGIVGWYYIATGAVCLFNSGITFQHPWILGLILFIGEWMTGFVLHFDRKPERGILDFFGISLRGKAFDEEN